MILNFKTKFPWGEPTNFKQKILDGTKIHSIRLDAGNRWKAGNTVHLSTGARTKNYNCFDKDECTGVQVIEIREYFLNESDYLSNSYTYSKNGTYRIFRIYIDGNLLDEDAVEQLARNDGFDSTRDFFRFFNKNFKGKIIHWTDRRY